MTDTPTEAPGPAAERPAGEQTDPPPTDDTPAAETAPDGDQDGGANAEAAKWRRRLRDTEAERDALTERITGAESAALNYALDVAGLDERLWRAAEVDVDWFRDESGALDIGEVIARAGQLKHELGIAGPRPNPQQGTPSQGRQYSLADAFDPFKPRSR
jgi:hypothetical protein